MMEMPVEIPEFPRLRGEKAVKALHGLVAELEEQRRNGSADKKTNALIKIAKGLISSIQAER